ncbi:NAD(P)/FAD-dependent oxidoreductase [Aestuariibaculum suncheonense]|uniref:NAD(P)/FAD-dependent oxidoreductase n=1 Tax=Aestuariibaculum suncheonense TaxID=1028745 RepID=A0A8J6QA42_9FLAO|nr:FAD/NAD(P)-binding oxidoreductase [Aestuariibaculum suncheonense]MBD0834153.1 NAD(P)/FAD-dependent oxidoreductase [Aestuariibaculum suncheonense]
MTTSVVIGGNFAGMTAALEIKRKGKDQHKVIMIDKSPLFLFIPSLIWVPFGRRDIKDISFRKDEILKKKGVDLLVAEALKVDTKKQEVHTNKGIVKYDHLVIATGPKVKYDVAPGVEEYAHYVGTPNGAMKIRTALEEFKRNPGPIVIGATQNAGCMGAAYEFLFNIEKWLREQNIRKKVDLYWITPETFLGHFGIDGITGGETMLKSFMKMFNIHFRTEVGVHEVTSDKVVLTSGEELPSRFTMLMPPFIGVDFVRNSPDLKATAAGYIPVTDDYRHTEIPNVWAAGIAVDVKLPFKPGKVPFSGPKTGYPSDETGKIVAENIIRVTEGKTELKKKAWGKIPGICIMDAGKKEVIILSNSLFKPRKFAIMIPNVLYDFNKVLFEKYFLWKTKRGLSYLP